MEARHTNSVTADIKRKIYTAGKEYLRKHPKPEKKNLLQKIKHTFSLHDNHKQAETFVNFDPEGTLSLEKQLWNLADIFGSLPNPNGELAKIILEIYDEQNLNVSSIKKKLSTHLNADLNFIMPELALIMKILVKKKFNTELANQIDIISEKIRQIGIDYLEKNPPKKYLFFHTAEQNFAKELKAYDSENLIIRINQQIKFLLSSLTRMDAKNELWSPIVKLLAELLALEVNDLIEQDKFQIMEQFKKSFKEKYPEKPPHEISSEEFIQFQNIYAQTTNYDSTLISQNQMEDQTILLYQNRLEILARMLKTLDQNTDKDVWLAKLITTRFVKIIRSQQLTANIYYDHNTLRRFSDVSDELLNMLKDITFSHDSQREISPRASASQSIHKSFGIFVHSAEINEDERRAAVAALSCTENQEKQALPSPRISS